MSSRFSVELEQLDRIVARLNDLAGFVHDHLDELDRRVQTLSSDGWDGVAASAYRDAHARWLASAREFADGIATAGDAAKKAHGRYTGAVDVNRRILRSGQG
ncbi:WXG100 family type VII secretion target [Nocardia alni]|uniref:WXG100 family type VII secretion target n=1 Tax=Nocardia alni TaxID=2815723 RepID=UPI001C21EE5F|nr:WXG100 family type VII secretion target [Nocardia alni]